MSEPSSPQTAVPFGKYHLLKRLAVGGMAELFLAQDTEREQLVVIKRILPYLSHEAEFVQMFLDEARIAAQLDHPNIIQVHELGKLQDSMFIAMEFVEGVDVRKVLAEETKRSQTMPYSAVAYVTAQICAGLEYAHTSHGVDGKPLDVIHRDVSPQNVMVSYDGAVKLVDFGIAKAGALMERSKPGVIKGKFLYLAPEQLSQERLDRRADLFAVGTMMYELTLGKAPFYKPTTEAVIYAIRNEEALPPHLARSDFPPELSRIVMKCLVKDRNRRYQSAAEIQRDLETYLRFHPYSQFDLASYIGQLFGTEDERTMVHIPSAVLPLPPRPAARPPPAPPPAPPSEALRPSGRGAPPPPPQNEPSRSVGRVPPPLRRPTQVEAPTAEEDESEPPTQQQRVDRDALMRDRAASFDRELNAWAEPLPSQREPIARERGLGMEREREPTRQDRPAMMERDSVTRQDRSPPPPNERGEQGSVELSSRSPMMPPPVRRSPGERYVGAGQEPEPTVTTSNGTADPERDIPTLARGIQVPSSPTLSSPTDPRGAGDRSEPVFDVTPPMPQTLPPNTDVSLGDVAMASGTEPDPDDLEQVDVTQALPRRSQRPDPREAFADEEELGNTTDDPLDEDDEEYLRPARSPVLMGIITFLVVLVLGLGAFWYLRPMLLGTPESTEPREPSPGRTAEEPPPANGAAAGASEGSPAPVTSAPTGGPDAVPGADAKAAPPEGSPTPEGETPPTAAAETTPTPRPETPPSAKPAAPTELKVI
ncbi:MAG TPA: protein kinase, partial [Myxococcaceae bacterium]|nr:protein kinase [Myxococcaceae bacterium]